MEASLSRHPRMLLSGVQSVFAWIPAKNMRE
jgi:hypothetical protein